ncbi:MAG: DUF4276 family protein [Melioribacteraceae bacterium]|nr:DUF4276 family protein [Melioribacteraceae bacterium]
MSKKVLVLVEGQTEERFIKRVLNPYLASKDIFFIPTIIKTKKEIRGPDHKGGISSYNQVRRDLLPLFGDSSAHIITTMIDYYGLPSDFPGYNRRPTGSCFDRVRFLEDQFRININQPKFLPYLQLHEFEALIFASEEIIPRVFVDASTELTRVADINNNFSSPEEINDGPTTAPSKRLKSIFPSYQKTLHSQLILSRSNLDSLRSKCNHFNSWLNTIEN